MLLVLIKLRLDVLEPTTPY